MLHQLGFGINLFPGSPNINGNISIGSNGFMIFPQEKYIWTLKTNLDPAFYI